MCDRLPEQITAECVQNSTDRQSKGEINKQLKHDTCIPGTIYISESKSQKPNLLQILTKYMYEI